MSSTKPPLLTADDETREMHLETAGKLYVLAARDFERGVQMRLADGDPDASADVTNWMTAAREQYAAAATSFQTAGEINLTADEKREALEVFRAAARCAGLGGQMDHQVALQALIDTLKQQVK